MTDATSNWELSFYTVTQVANNELLVRPRSSSSSIVIPPIHAVPASNARMGSEQSHLHGSFDHESQSGSESHKTSGAKHRTGTEKENSHGLKLDPIRQDKLQTVDHSTNHMQPYSLSEKRMSVNQKAYPKHVGHWAAVDEGNKLFDFLSPARGKGSVSPPAQAAPVKSYMKSKDTAIKSHHESGSKPQLGRGQSSPLPTLSPRITSQNSNLGNKKSRSSNSLKEPVRPTSRAGKDRKTYVKFDEVTISNQKPKVDIEKKPKSPPKPRLTDSEQFKIVIKDQFKKYDTNNDGIISRKEAALLLQQNVVDSNGPDIKVALDFILSKMDFDKDGRITYAEYEMCVLREPLLQNCFGAQGLKLDGPSLK